jgi:small subunit ribosomal protein S4
VRKQSVETLPFQLARETFGDRPIPAWMQVVPGSLQILIHQLPTRAQIDTVLTEQLIVEYYSKT